jgi:hypothetical protein
LPSWRSLVPAATGALAASSIVAPWNEQTSTSETLPCRPDQDVAPQARGSNVVNCSLFVVILWYYSTGVGEVRRRQ